MKSLFKKIIANLFALTLLLDCLSTGACATDGDPGGAKPDASAHESLAFLSELSDLLIEQDTTAFFGEMELVVGLDILTVDGQKQVLDAAPIVLNNRTMVPIRAVAEVTGASVDWISDSKSVVIESQYGDEITCAIGSDTISINDRDERLDTAPFVKDGRTYLPLRAVSEALGLDVDWDASNQSITLSAPYQSARVIVMADSVDSSSVHPQKSISDGEGMWVLQFSNPIEAREAVDILSAEGYMAEPDYYIPPIQDAVIDDAQSTLDLSWGVQECHFDTFLQQYAGLFSGIATVAVVDTGVDAEHPLLSGRVLPGYDIIDGDNSPLDGHGHGTHVSRIISARFGGSNMEGECGMTGIYYLPSGGRTA